MKATFKMPKVADSVDEVTVVEWHKSPGDPVAAGEVLLHVETDKAIVEVPCPISGTLLELLVQIDSDVRTGDAVARLETT